MSWESIQQMLRIAMNALGAYLVSVGWPEDMTIMLTGTVLSGGAVAWWAYWNFMSPKVPE